MYMEREYVIMIFQNRKIDGVVKKLVLGPRFSSKGK